MTWTERLSLRIAKSIKTDDTQFTLGQLAHGVEIFVLNVINGIILVISAVILNLISEVIPLVCFFFLLRLCTGGVHLKNPWSCLTFTVGLMLSGAALIKYLPELPSPYALLLLLLLGGIGFLINFWYAPAKHTYVPTDPKIQQRNRVIVLVLIVSGCILFGILIEYTYKLSMTYILAVLLQSILLMPSSFRVASYLENKF